MSSLSRNFARALLATGLGLVGLNGYGLSFQSPEDIQHQYRSLTADDADKLLHREKIDQGIWVLMGLGIAARSLNELKHIP